MCPVRRRMRILQTPLHLCPLLLYVSALLHPPENLIFFSQNFQHILTWKEPNNKSLIYYFVEYSERNGNFTPVNDCSNITAQHCDLTKHFTEIFQPYKTKVYSSTSDDVSRAAYLDYGFPYAETTLGPAIVDVVACENCIELSLQPPVSYLWSKTLNHTVPILSDPVYPSLQYTVQLWPSAGSPIEYTDISEEKFTTQISSLLPNANYCVSVTVMGYTKGVASPTKCVITKASKLPGDRTIYIVVPLAIILLMALLTLLFVLDKAGFINRKKTLPPDVLQYLPIQNTLLHEQNESTLLVSLVSMERKHSIVNNNGYTNRARLPGTTPYIVNNAAGRQEFSSQDIDPSTEGEDLSILGNLTTELSGVILSAEPSNENTIFSGEDIIQRKHRKVTEMPERCLQVHKFLGDDNRQTFTSDAANNLSLNGTKIFTIDLNSVSLADSEDLGESVSLHIDGDSLFTTPPSVYDGDEPRMVTLEHDHNEERDTLHKDNFNDHLPSAYIRR